MKNLASKNIVSVIIPFLNAEEFIREAIESVFAQTYIIDSGGRLYFIDEDALGYNIKGFGFSRVSTTFNYDQAKYFFKGYNSINDIGFFSQDYIKFDCLLYSIAMVEYILRFWEKCKNSLSFELKNLLRLIEE
ncbi:MAG: hypothetical protein JRI96_14410 [Deltaproteobacteria bacterium]|nr:hypothetical protein [Deltaproteobacteria bacterium]